MRRTTVTLLLLLAVALGGCSDGDDVPEPTAADYTPVPDDELFEQVAALPDVEQSEASFNDTFPEETYIVEIRLTTDAADRAEERAEQTVAILRQGRYRASINLQVVVGNRIVDTSSTRWPELEEQYGPQPGDGTPPED